MAGRASMTLCEACVPTGDSHHGSPEGLLADLHQQVDMIRHPTVRMHSHTEAFDDFTHERAESLAICGVEEDVLAMIAAQDYMVKAAFDVQARGSGHPCRSDAGTGDA
jgi:hypothetical protein